MRTNTTWHQAKTALSALPLGIITAFTAPSWADNPIVQTSYTADPAPMVYEGRLYLYTSHDEDVTVSNFFTMNDWRVYSTVDMVNWTDHGSPAGYKTFKWGTDNAWAPQGIARNGKFYLYVPLNNNTGAKIGVGVSTSPFGPFTDPIGKELVSNGAMAIDPTVFVDDDGQGHLYWGNGNLRYVKLNSDMISTSGSVASNVSLDQFVEGPWFYKRGSLYYMVYAAGSGNEKLSYATSSAAAGPWTYRGDIMAAGSIFTNHPGVVDYKDHSYFFYHNGALPGGGGYKRSVCVEEFTYGTDGSIPKITASTKGPTAVATLDPFTQVEAETIAFSSGLKTEVCSDTGGGMNVSAISNGDYIKVKDVDFLDGATSFEARVSSAASNAKIELHLDSQTGTLLGSCDVSGASSWTTKTCSVTGGSGKHDLFLKFTGGSGDLFKFNWWKFTGSTTNNGTGGAGGAGAGGTSASGTNAGGTRPVNASSAGSGPAQQAGGSANGAGGKKASSAEGSGGKKTDSGSANSAGGTVAAGGSPVTGSKGGATTRAAGSDSSGKSGVSEGDRGGSGGTSARASSTRTATTQGFGASPDTSATDSSTPPDSGSCSCRVGSSRGKSGALAALAIVAFAFLRRRRGVGTPSRGIL
ncbi:MAG TPA: family 43 glycosylhydrolase [Polyangiaceae bacterium]|nr:family 43 glycosylhydrolase [Polyangiaceae bacterium]